MSVVLTIYLEYQIQNPGEIIHFERAGLKYPENFFHGAVFGTETLHGPQRREN